MTDRAPRDATAGVMPPRRSHLGRTRRSRASSIRVIERGSRRRAAYNAAMASETLAGECRLQQDIKKSRFAAAAAPLDAVDDALRFVARVSDAAATHNCWAYRHGQQYRFSDDGEPGGTAGRPILQAIDGQGLDRVVVVVTRWFGGIKLGAGGLARAYGGCAAECLRLAARLPIVERTTLEVRCDFPTLPILHARLPEFAAERLDETFDADGARLRVALPRVRAAAFADWLRDLTRGRGSVREAESSAE